MAGFAEFINNEPLDKWGRDHATNNYWERKANRGNGLTGVTNQYGVDLGSKTYAGDTYAALTRDQWQQYVSTFVPLENQLIDFATNPTP